MSTQVDNPAVEREPPRKLQMGLQLDTHIKAALQHEAERTAEDMSTIVRMILRQHFGLDRRNAQPPLS